MSSLREEVSDVRDVLKGERERVGEMWRMNCSQVAGFDEAIITKEKEIDSLRSRVPEFEASMGGGPVLSASMFPMVPAVLPPVLPALAHAQSSSAVPTPDRRGKAPPVNEYSSEDHECLLDDWLPSLNRASLWNGWSEEEQMIQLAGHLKG